MQASFAVVVMCIFGLASSLTCNVGSETEYIGCAAGMTAPAATSVSTDCLVMDKCITYKYAYTVAGCETEMAIGACGGGTGTTAITCDSLKAAITTATDEWDCDVCTTANCNEIELGHEGHDHSGHAAPTAAPGAASGAQGIASGPLLAIAGVGVVQMFA